MGVQRRVHDVYDKMATKEGGRWSQEGVGVGVDVDVDVDVRCRLVCR